MPHFGKGGERSEGAGGIFSFLVILSTSEESYAFSPF